MDEAINSILSSSLVAALLGAGLVFVHRHHMADKKELKETIREKDISIVMKDSALATQADEIKEMLRENIAIETRLLDVLKSNNHGR